MRNEALKFRQKAHRALHDKTLQKALKGFTVGYPLLRKKAIHHFPDFKRTSNRARTIKDKSLNNLEKLTEQFREKIEKRGGKLIVCSTAEAARTAVTDICEQHHAELVTKSKSMVSEEIALNDALEEKGIKVLETDLGEYIVQLAKEPPSHIVGPALHKTKEDVAALFKKHHKDRKKHAKSAQGLVQEAREELRQKYFEADVGITGANFLVAETGSCAIVTNEGNADLCRVLPRTHIVISSIEKVIPTLNDLSVFLRLLGRSASGQALTTYTTLVSGPKSPGEEEGPDNFYVVLVDNGRSKLLGTPQQDLLRCIKCGACMNICPVYGAVGGHTYGWVYPGPIGAALNPLLEGPKKMKHQYNATTFCGACQEVCPVQIPLVKMFRHWRQTAFKKRIVSRKERLGVGLWTFLAARPALYQLAKGTIPPMIKLMSGAKGYLRRLPFGRGWLQGRVLPAPQQRKKK